jgi:leader peptidase (prepilin peptidase)/N-methyltransferase
MLSFMAQGGRCRSCGSKISIQYPLVEALSGIIFILIFFRISNYHFLISTDKFLGGLPAAVYYWTIFSLLIVISVYDFYHQIIPNKPVYFLVGLSFFSPFLNILNFNHKAWNNLFGIMDLKFEVLNFVSSITGGIIFFSFFASLWLVSRGRWMGFGDAKLALAIGLFLGLPFGSIAIIFSFWIGALVSIFLLIFCRKSFTTKSPLPFGPFLAIAAFIVFLLSSPGLSFAFLVPAVFLSGF